MTIYAFWEFRISNRACLSRLLCVVIGGADARIKMRVIHSKFADINSNIDSPFGSRKILTPYMDSISTSHHRHNTVLSVLSHNNRYCYDVYFNSGDPKGMQQN
jgi:hypothetical protein